MTTTRRTILTGLAALGTASSPRAQELSQGPIRIVAGFAAGGSSDSMARLVADRLRDSLGRTVIVENVAGAGGRLAAEQVKAATPDGTRILLANTVMMSLSPLVFSDLRYGPLTDFVAVAKAAEYQLVLATGAATKAGTFAGLKSWLIANPDKGAYGVPAAGSLPHLYALQVAASTGLPMTMVPFRGGAPMAQALAGGHLAMAFSASSDFTEQHRSGLLRIVAQSGSRRHPVLPDVETFTEAGIAGAEENGWNGFFLPKGTPQPIVDRYAAAIRDALAEPGMVARLETLGFLTAFAAGPDLARQITAEQAHWKPLVTSAGLAQ